MAKFSDLARRYQPCSCLRIKDGRDINPIGVANEYLRLPHAPHNPDVVYAYGLFKAELIDQYEFLKAHDYTLRPWLREGQPYASSVEMIADIKFRGSLWVFCGGDLPSDHPLAPGARDGMTYNEIFRGVHDIFGHAVPGNKYETYDGEIAAYRAHSEMFSRGAWPALFTETVAQLCAFYYGPHPGKFPEQKALVMEW